MRNLLRTFWHLLPQGTRTAIVGSADRTYLLVNRSNDKIRDWYRGIDTCWEQKKNDVKSGDSILGDPVRTQSTPYSNLFKLRKSLKLTKTDKFVDIGCGSGRVTLFMAEADIAHSKGIDFDEAAIKSAKNNLETAARLSAPVEFEKQDAAQSGFLDETIIFLGNPFGEDTIARVLLNVQKSTQDNDRHLKICYYNPVHKGIFDAQHWLEHEDTIEGRMKNILIYAHRPKTK